MKSLNKNKMIIVKLIKIVSDQFLYVNLTMVILIMFIIIKKNKLNKIIKIDNLNH